jgi:hypothetical protein
MKYLPNEFPKTCRCCGLIHTERDWLEDLRPNPKLADRHLEGDRLLALQFANCTCGTTLAVRVEFPDALDDFTTGVP